MNKKELMKQYWYYKLSGINKIQLIPDNYNVIYNKYQSIDLFFDTELSLEIDNVTKNNHLSNFVLFLTGLKIFMNNLTGQSDLYVLSPKFQNNDLGNGKFNILRDIIDNEITFKELLYQVAETVKGSIQNESYPLNDILKSLNLDVENDLYKVIYSFNNNNNNNNNNFSEEEISEFDVDLYIKCLKKNDQYGIEITYNEDRFLSQTIQKYLQYYCQIINQVIKTKDIKIKDICLISEDEQESILKLQKGSDVKWESNSILDRFTNIVEKFGDKVAVYTTLDSIDIYNNLKNDYQLLSLTYKELNLKSDILAKHLIEKGVKPNSIVTLFLDHPIDITIAIFAVLKSNAAYLSLNPSNPLKHNSKILNDSNSKLIITRNSIDSLKKYNDKIEKLDFNLIHSATYSSRFEWEQYSGNQAAYILYTSGTTGTQKGVVVGKASLENYINWKIEEFHYTNEDITLQPLAYNFDGFNANFYPSLLTGGTLCFVPDDKRAEPKVYKYLFHKFKITNVNIVPQLLKLIIDNIEADHLKSLRFIVVAGEKCQNELINAIINKLPTTKISNEYGPTETTIGSSIKHNISEELVSNIGKSIPNTCLMVLNENMKIIPPGFIGEICISGEGVSKGYINNPELTHKHFVNVDGLINDRVYKTGDIGRGYGADIELIGRSDEQLKIRGNLVNIQYVESRVASQKNISEVKIIVREGSNKDKELIAFYVSKNEDSDINWRDILIDELPDYMIPSKFISLNEFPVLANGKIDVNSLSRKIGIKNNRGRKGKRDYSKAEKKLIAIWCEILEIDESEISLDSNFFEFGGHSIKAIILAANIEKIFNIDINIMDVFENSTLSKLVSFISNNSESCDNEFRFSEKKEFYELSSAQKRIYIMHNAMPDNTSYNIPQVLEIHGELDVLHFERCLNELIDRHDSLRTSFINVNDKPVQKISRNSSINLVKDSIEQKDLDEYIQNFICPFDLENSPLLRANLVATNENMYYLLIDIHHIITDWISISVISDELLNLFSKNKANITKCKYRYSDFSEWQNKKLKSEKILESEQYWKQLFSGRVNPVKLPYDNDSEKNLSTGETILLDINNECYNKLKSIAENKDMTMFMVLLGYFNIFLSKISNSLEVIVGTESFGRNIKEIENIVGMFVNTIPIKSYPDSGKSISEYMDQVRNTVIEALRHEDYQYDVLIENLAKNNNTYRSSFINTFFSYQKINKLPNYSLNNNGNSVKLIPYSYNNSTTKFELTLNVVEENELHASFEYNSNLFKKETMIRLADYFKNLLENLDLNVKIGEMTMFFENGNNSQSELSKEIENINSVPDFDSSVGEMSGFLF